MLVCPRDGAQLEWLRYESDIEVERCPSCRGMWLDHGKLEALQRITERDYRSKLDEPVDSVSTMLEQAKLLQAPIQCPKCGGEMETREYAQCSQIVIDSCVDGCGIWLDAGELEALEKLYERGNRDADGAAESFEYLWVSLVGLLRRPWKKRR
jgi:Zn-finger nucleic acid-binding protein